MCESIDSKQVKIRKPRRCDGCLRDYPVGTMMHHSVTKDDESGRLWRNYLCACCEAFTNSQPTYECQVLPYLTVRGWDYKEFSEKWQQQNNPAQPGRR